MITKAGLRLGRKSLENKPVLAKIVLVLTLALGSGVLAKADPIGPNCDSDGSGPDEDTCQGSIYALISLGTVVPDTTDILYRIDTNTYTGIGTFIDAAGIKVLDSMTGTTLVSAPGGVGNWTLVLGTLNASGCEDIAADPFACADDTVSGIGGHAPVGGILEWVFRVPATSGFLDPSSIKARYVNDAGDKVGALVSEHIQLQPIPEPATLLLLGTGLLAIGRLRRKKKALVSHSGSA